MWVNKRNAWQACCLLLLVTVLATACSDNHAEDSEKRGGTEQAEVDEGLVTIHIAGVPLKVEVAQDDRTALEGLMYRDRLPENQGMLFVFPGPRVLTFWMRNTFIPLDIAFIDENGVIVDIQHMVPLDETRRYVSAAPAQYALEVNVGWFRKHGVQVGQKVQF
ncbi:MAG: DUF192 domain-containing protein [Calditrichaeota bacterium]|nr:MAG: DUF192 domain-containing protein [Calditrichota bacterium]